MNITILPRRHDKNIAATWPFLALGALVTPAFVIGACNVASALAGLGAAN